MSHKMFDRPSLGQALQATAHLLAIPDQLPSVGDWTDQLKEADVQSGDLVKVLTKDPNVAIAIVMAALALDGAVWLSPTNRVSIQDDRASILIDDQAVTRWRPPNTTMTKSIALVHETSGSSADPRPACRSVTSIMSEANGYRSGLGFGPGTRLRVAAPTVHSFGCGVALAGLLAACTVDVTAVRLPTRLARQLDEAPFDVVATTPPMASLLANVPAEHRHGSHALLFVGAGVVSQDLEDRLTTRFGAAMLRGYGSTETGGTFIGRTGLGSPIAGITVKRPGLGESGELVLDMEAPVLGYLGARHQCDRVWTTGDRVRRASDGTLAFEGRMEMDRLRLNGGFVDAHAVRRTLESVPGVTAVLTLVIGRARASEMEELWIVVVGSELSPAALLTLVDECLPEVPARLRVMSELPLNDIGKLDRAELERELQHA